MELTTRRLLNLPRSSRGKCGPEREREEPEMEAEKTQLRAEGKKYVTRSEGLNFHHHHPSFDVSMVFLSWVDCD